MSKKDLEYIKIIYENMVGDISLKNLFYGLKSMLDDGDDFRYEEQRRFKYGTRHDAILFIYKGTRNIIVSIDKHPSKFSSIEQDVDPTLVVDIYEIDGNGDEVNIGDNVFEYIGKTEADEWYKHEHNIPQDQYFERDIYKWRVDPNIDSVIKFVDFVKSVLDRSDRDPKNDDIVPTISPKIKNKPFVGV